MAYLNERGLKSDTSKVGLIGNIDYNKERVRVGAVSPSYDLKRLINSYNIGISQRQKTPDDCKERKFKPAAITERSFDFDLIKND
ncbi:hypothetical protein V6R21_03495 [Limibacter armeniacum]|uniref:hypothetical protein n=1 Tax=Limibacter armeniacum TaxID=466084 RepID=UPI002FE59862